MKYKKIAILGYGTEGKSVHRFLKKSSKFKGGKITILDKKRDRDYLKHIPEFDLVFRSPGIRYEQPIIRRAIKNGVEFSSAVKLFFDEFKGIIIGVTGSKGKGTTATFIYHILKACDEDVYLAGNIGKSPLDILPKLKKTSVVILELSSFQLQDLHKSPRIAVVLDVFPEHLDYHKNFQEYIEAKKNIAVHQKRRDTIFYFRDNKLLKKIARFGKGKKISIPGKTLGLRKNAAMAATITSYLGCDPEKTFVTIRRFRGMKHRLETVGKIGNILFYNDSASTNPHTAAMAIFTLSRKPGSTILIAGGKDKGLNYAPLRRAIKESKHVDCVILFGENKRKIRKTLSSVTKIKYAKNLRAATSEAYDTAKKIGKSSPIVKIILSPGAASFDMFRDYKERGEKFRVFVKKLK